MNCKQFDLSILENPEIFEINRLPAHSDHWRTDEKGNIVEDMSLDGKWNFKYFDRACDIDFSTICSAAAEDEIPVPSHIELNGYGQIQYVNTQYPFDGVEEIEPPTLPVNNPVGLYKKSFVISHEKLENETLIVFDGVESAIALWLNDKFVGYSQDSFTPSEFNLTPYLVSGENTITAAVFRYCTGTWLEDQDMFRFSGIFRSVKIISFRKAEITDVDTVQQIYGDYEEAELDVSVKLNVKSLRSVQYKVTLLCGDEAVSGTVGKLFIGENTSQIKAKLKVMKPKLWSAEAPNLYTLKTVISDAQDKYLCSAETEIGFRKFELRDKIMYLNGKRIVFKGVNRHEFECTCGRAISEELIENDLKLIKRNNINAVRTSHYPNQSSFYRLCDRLGLYVIDETNLETHGTWMIMGMPVGGEKAIPADKAEWKRAVMDRGASMLERDKNHACILMWSCGNESYGGTVIRDLSEYFKKRDNSRLVHYEGVFQERTYDYLSDVESQMYTFPADTEEYLKDNPEKPFIHCEYEHSMGNSTGNMDEYIALAEKYPMYQGGFIWDFADQAIMTETQDGIKYLGVGGDFGDRPNDGYFSGNGLVFADHTESPKLSEVKHLYSPIELICDKNGVLIKNKNSYISTENLSFVYKWAENGKTVKTGSFTADVKADEEKYVELCFDASAYSGEVILDVSAQLAKDTYYAVAGHEIAFGQSVVKEAKPIEKSVKAAKVISGDCNIGIKAKDSSFMFNRVSGELISIKFGDREYLRGNLVPDFWRAPVDNDYPNMNVQNWVQWKLASMYRICMDIEENREAGEVKVKYVYPTEPSSGTTLIFKFFDDNRVSVHMTLDRGPKNGLPCYGAACKIAEAFDELRWYGNTQHESSSDRRNGKRIGLESSKVGEQYVPYLNPQDCANKTDLRMLELNDGDGHGIRITSDKPFEASALPWTSHEIENAHHTINLPPYTDTVLCLYAQKAGVGGDDTWGAPVHGKYLIPSEYPMEFDFEIEVF